MKKKILGFVLLALAFISFDIKAQLPVASKRHVVGNFKVGDAVDINPLKADTLKSGDTIAYLIEVKHIGIVYPYMTQKFTKISTVDTTVTIAFFQSTNYYNSNHWFAVITGSGTSAYTQSVTATNGYYGNYLFNKDAAWFESYWLAVVYTAKGKTGFKSIPQASIIFQCN